MRAHDTLRGIQRTLREYYALEDAPDVCDFVHFGDSRETLYVREANDALELSLHLPAQDPGDARAPEPAGDDTHLQLIEGVSHFVYIAERARMELPATQLELELQAEVDKFVYLGLGMTASPHERSTLRTRLYEEVRYLHPQGTELGDRYRMATAVAARFVARLDERLDKASVQRHLRRFYRAGQTEKLSIALAA
ncbi:MAG: hypothetical protein SFV15_11380 [Polyangiaceae bacterium]|nr:hypothetical protein [Polyangiaceae bacterium]